MHWGKGTTELLQGHDTSFAVGLFSMSLPTDSDVEECGDKESESDER
jgi:hypothetical protein